MFSFRDQERENILINSLNELLNNYRVRNSMNYLSLPNDISSNERLSYYSANNETNTYLNRPYSLEDYIFFTNQRNNILYNELENTIINSLEMSENKYKKIISEKGKEKLKTIKFRKCDNNYKNDTCPILQTEFEDNEEITQLPCNHCFNTEAILHWLEKEKAECPVCRIELDYNEEKIQEQENTLSVIPLNLPTNMDMDNNYLESLISSRENLFESFTRTYTDPFTLINNEDETQDNDFQEALLLSLN